MPYSAYLKKGEGDGMAGLWRYLARRAVDRFLVLFFALILSFVLLRVIPYYVLGIDPSFFFLNPHMSEEQQKLIRSRFGLDEPIFPNQFIRYVLSLFKGDLGYSLYTGRPVAAELMERLPNTVLLLGTATVLQVLIGLTVGIVATMKRGSKVDATVVGLGLFLNAFPAFFVGLLLLLCFGYYLGLFPIAGTVSRPPPRDPVAYVLDLLHHLALPLTTLTVVGFGGFALLIRSLLVSQLGQDYIITARAKGVPERIIMFKHVLRNVLGPILTILALTLPGIVSGAVITETIFSWYGVGRWLFDASMQFDFPIVQGVLFIYIVLTLISLLIVDVILGIVDPRVRLE